MSLKKLVFDPSDIANVERYDNVGSYLISAGGALITSTSIGGIEALDVNLASPLSIEVDLDGLYDGVDNLNPDTVGLIIHNRGASLDETSLLFRSSGGTADADAIVAANVHGQDVMSFDMGFNGTTWDRMRGYNFEKKMYDGASSFETEAVAVTTTAAEFAATPLANRKRVLIQNNGNKAVAVNHIVGGTFDDGLIIPAGGALERPWDESVDIFLVSEQGSQDVRILQEAA